MDKVTQSSISPQTGTTSPLSPKRQKTDCTSFNNHCGKSKFDFPKLLTFQKNISSTSSTSVLLKNEGLICTAESGDFQDVKPHEQPQDTKLDVSSITKVTTSHSYSADTGSSEVRFITAEGHLLLRGKDEQPPVTETDKLSSYPGDVTGGSLADSPSTANSDTPSHPDGKQLGKSPEDGILGSCSLSARKIENDASQIQTVTLSSRNEEIRYQPDCTDIINAGPDTSYCSTLSQFAEVQTNQLFSKEESAMSSSDKPKDDQSENLPEGGCKTELQFCEIENVSVCDGETKGQANENSMSTTIIPSAAGCADRSTLTYEVVLERQIAVENLEVDDFCGAKEGHTAGKIITKACNEAADHTTETPMPAGISQGLAEGDNGAGPFSVIDPAIWSETDREAEEKRCNSDRTAGVELSPSVKVCEWETALLLCSDVRPSQEVSSPDQFNRQNRTQQCKDENGELCQSYTESQAFSVIASGTHNEIGSEGNCQWNYSPHSSPAKSLPAGNDGLQGSCDTAAHQLKAQSQSGCFSVSSDHMKTQEVEFSQCEIARLDKRAEIKETENYEEARNEQQRDDTTEMSIGEFISDWSGEEDIKLPFIEGELANVPECFPDCLFNADISMMDVTTDKGEKRQEMNVREEIKTDGAENSERRDVQLQNECMVEVTDVLCGEQVSECTEGTTFTLSNGHQQEHKLSCFPDDQLSTEMSIAKNNDDILAISLSSTSDAVVPYQHDLSHSHNAHMNPTAPNCCDRFSPLPSAFTSYNRLLGGFDTFEKIQLSPDDDDAAGLANIALLNSLSAQLLKTPEHQPHHSMSESDKEKPAEEEEGGELVGRFGTHAENMGNEFSFEVPNFISATDVIALSEQESDYESACYSSECIQTQLNSQSTVSTESDSSTSNLIHNSEFEMKEHFNMVLKELNLFFEISRNDFASEPSSPEPCKDTSCEAFEGNASKCQEHLSSKEVELSRGTSSDDADEDRSLEMCGGEPVVSRTALRGDGEQEVPLSRHLCQETSTDTVNKHREPQETEQKEKMWSSAFMCLPPQELLRPPEQPRRLEPLKTCTRPIRVGLSKRAKTKRLHCPHPYK